MPPKDQAALQNHASVASMKHVLKRTAGIINTIREYARNEATDERFDYEVPGAGLPVKWGSHYSFATAAHVVDGAVPTQLRIATFADEPESPINHDRLRNRDLLTGTVLLGDCDIHRCSWDDLALITVDPNKFPGVDFVEVGNDWIDPPVDELVHFCGFPTDHSVKLNRKQVAANRHEVDWVVWPTICSGKVLPVPNAEEVKFRYSSFEPERHYLVPYDGAGVSKNAKGISGSAVWWEPPERQLVWRPTFKFAGMCVAWFPKRSHVQVN